VSGGARVGVALVGHGVTASQILAAARGILPSDDALVDVVAVDAGPGETPELGPTLCNAIEALDQGRGVLLMVDLLGASPYRCATREGTGHDFAVLSGMNLAMVLKLATLDRTELDPFEIAKACADSGQRSVKVSTYNAPSSGAKRAAGEDG
jgi:mannose/fructose-specific phosphotransferase system component IIA